MVTGFDRFHATSFFIAHMKDPLEPLNHRNDDGESLVVFLPVVQEERDMVRWNKKNKNLMR